jgi:flagellar P-ring protein precursor FlgI
MSNSLTPRNFNSPQCSGRWESGAAQAAALLLLVLSATHASGQVRLGDVCRVKGQEGNTLHGFGLVVGLNGTGDGDKPATRMLAQTMSRMGALVGRDKNGGVDLSELKNAKNVALVFVSAEVPAMGARQGGKINCEVSAVSAKSLQGGTLLLTPLLGPHPSDRNIYAVASGSLTVEDASRQTVARVHTGAQLTKEFQYKFHDDGLLTLVVEPNHSSFQMARVVEDAVNQFFLRADAGDDDSFASAGDGKEIAKAVDARTIEVRIPALDLESPVDFVATILSIPLEIREVGGTRVVIREKSQLIVVGRDVMIRPVAVSHKSLTIEAGGRNIQDFVSISPTRNSSDPSFALSSLVNALNALKVAPEDKIEIIKAIDRQGALLGELVVE